MFVTLDNDNKDILYMTDRGPGILTAINTRGSQEPVSFTWL